MSANLTFGGWLKRRRQGLGLTQKELADRIGYAEVSVRKTEADERRPSREMAEKLAHHLEIPPAQREKFVAFARDGAGWADFTLNPQTAAVDDLDVATLRGLNEMAASPYILPRFHHEEIAGAEPESGAFVAREREVARLLQHLDQAVTGRGQIVFLTGEAGTGKSTLMRAFARRAQERYPALSVAAGTCHVYTGVGDPYLPFRQILETLSGDVESQWASGIITRDNAQRMWRHLPHVVDTIVSRGPDLLDTFVSVRGLAARSLAHESHSTAWRERLQTSAAHAVHRGPDQSRLFEEYADVVQTLAAQQPILLLLDDLHWADVSSVALLFHLARTITGYPICIVGAYRPEDMASTQGQQTLDSVLGEIQREYGDVKISLDQEVEEDRLRFVYDLLDLEPNQLGAEFRQALFVHGHGHPLFTVELLRDMQDRGDLVRNGDGRWVVSHELAWDNVPARVEGVIEQRIGRLDGRLLEVLAVASVVGESFAAEVVAKVMQADERQVVQWLSADLQKQHRLVRAESVRTVGAKRLSYYRFGHSLFHLYVYRTLDDAQRVYLHEAAGNALHNIYRDQDEFTSIAGALAHHFDEAQLPDRAVRYHLLAGRHAVQMSAHQEAIVHLQQGLAQIGKMPDTPERNAQELALRLGLAVSITTKRGYANPAAYEQYGRAQHLAEQQGDSLERFQALYGLWRYSVMGAHLEEAQQRGEQLMRLAEESQDSGLMLEALRAMGVNHFHLGQFEPARAELEAGIALYDIDLYRTHAYQYGHDPAISCYAYLAKTLLIVGDFDGGRENLRRLVRLAWELAHPFSLGYAMAFSAVLCQLQQDVTGTLRWAEQALALAERRGYPFWQAISLIMRGWALAMQGATVDCTALVQEGLSIWRNTGAGGLVPYFVCLLGETCAQRGEAGAGLAAVDGGLATIAATHEAFYEAELHRVRGELMLLRSSRDEAETAFRRALEIARRQHAMALERRALASLERL